MLQVALGGLAAIPVSLLLMWHLLGTDIGDAAPWVAQYAPWIVPQKFHAYAPRAVVPANQTPAGSLPAPAAAETTLAGPDQAAPADTADEIPTVQPRALSDIDLAVDTPGAANDPMPNQAQTIDTLSAADTLMKSGRSDDDQQPGRSNAAEPGDGPTSSDNLENSDGLSRESLTSTLEGLDGLDRGGLGGLDGTQLDGPQLDGRELEDSNSNGSVTADKQSNPADLEEPSLAAGSPADENRAENAAESSGLQSTGDLDSTALEKCFASIRQTNSMLEEWSQAVAAKQHDQPLAQSTYAALAGLALAIDAIPSRELVQQAVRGQLRPVRRLVQQKPEIRSLIDQGARFWIRNQLQTTSAEKDEADASNTNMASSSGRYGLALTAVIDSITPSSDGQWSTVTASSTTQSGEAAKLPVDVRIGQDVIDSLPEGKLSIGQKLFLLGTVDSPGEDAADDSQQPRLTANYLAPL